MDEIVERMVAFVQKCLLSDCELVIFVTRYAIWVGWMSSVGANVYHCVTRCGQDIESILHLTPAAIGQCSWRSISPNDVGRDNLLAELLLLLSGVLTFSSSGFSRRKLTVLLRTLHATIFSFISFIPFLCLYSVYDFIINI